MMTITIDWDNYEVIESEDYTQDELSDTIEDVREAMDHLALVHMSIPEPLAELLEQLTDMEDREVPSEGTTQG